MCPEVFAQRLEADWDRDVKCDQELFVKQMMNLRGWDPSRAMEEWKRFDLDSSVARDMKGPRHSQLRLFIPGNLFGADTKDRGNLHGETRKLAQASKKQKMSAEDQEQLRKEVGRGFAVHLSHATKVSSEDLCRPLPSGALTEPVAEIKGPLTVADMLVDEVAALQPPAAVASTSAAAAPPPSSSTSTDPSDSGLDLRLSAPTRLRFP